MQRIAALAALMATSMSAAAVHSSAPAIALGTFFGMMLLVHRERPDRAKMFHQAQPIYRLAYSRNHQLSDLHNRNNHLRSEPGRKDLYSRSPMRF